MKIRCKPNNLLLCICIAVCQLIGSASVTIAREDTKYITEKNEITYNEYLYIPFGESEDMLGGVSYTDAESLGPKSFAIMSDGTVYILDKKHIRK
jgi:hypothetical protein